VLNPTKSLLEIEFTPEKISDALFMVQLFNSTKPFFYELGLPLGAVEIMLAQQYQLQQTGYKIQFPNAATFILRHHGQAIGKVMIDNNGHTIHIIDLAIIPQMRGRGFGSVILDCIKLNATRLGLPVCLSVNKDNVRAKRLYQNHGFCTADVSDTHESMFWRASTLSAVKASSSELT
jgi:ribosomal protein S18 acetylase RimI-like enzyme